MSEELKVELLNYKKERNKKILIIGLIALFLSLFFVITYAIYYRILIYIKFLIPFHKLIL